mmetsp:Transcript_21419/g.44614  ORF Transcript_21419/g.44614 Transcript_21419/m.44614 type:complete len:280 (-) Transcript_21419:681-1520(-)
MRRLEGELVEALSARDDCLLRLLILETRSIEVSGIPVEVRLVAIHNARRFKVVTPCPSDLLVVFLHSLGWRIVDDSPSVRLVDSHTEGSRSYDNRNGRSEEVNVSFLPIPVTEPCMVFRGQHAVVILAVDPVAYIVYELLRVAVNNRRLVGGIAFDSIKKPLEVAGVTSGTLPLDLEDQVLTIDARRDNLGVGHHKRVDDVVPDLGCTGCRERYYWDVTDFRGFADDVQPAVITTEVMTPLTDTVGLVNCNERKPPLGLLMKAHDVVQPVGKLLRRKVD